MIFDDLRAIQLRYGFLPKVELEGLSQRTLTPLYQLHSVASFYPHFRLAPPAKAEIRVCADMSCHLNGACELRTELQRRFAGCRPEEVQIRDVSCLGRCDHAPAISINDEILSEASAASAEQMALRALRGEEVAEPHPERARVECKADPYGDGDDKKYDVLRRLVESRAWDDVLAQLKAADLRGMGGAGFPTSMKWDLVRKQRDPVKYVVCNADESEPGTIKDRFIMTHLPHLVIEGMIIAGVVTGAKRGILYIRHEYAIEEEIIGGEIRRCYRLGLLGKGILSSDL
ncbi:MAG: NAD(P)H-dependent oxidoreductase subunit E, partial [Acidobacteria bacterium Pan2503]|nr:NAD(P)H-dependent oxidoreductase subunit E [Candidatus Acidoferrum panamensis]